MRMLCVSLKITKKNYSWIVLYKQFSYDWFFFYIFILLQRFWNQFRRETIFLVKLMKIIKSSFMQVMFRPDKQLINGNNKNQVFSGFLFGEYWTEHLNLHNLIMLVMSHFCFLNRNLVHTANRCRYQSKALAICHYVNPYLEMDADLYKIVKWNYNHGQRSIFRW